MNLSFRKAYQSERHTHGYPRFVAQSRKVFDFSRPDSMLLEMDLLAPTLPVHHVVPEIPRTMWMQTVSTDPEDQLQVAESDCLGPASRKGSEGMDGLTSLQPALA